jgi:hypothetical protein
MRKTIHSLAAVGTLIVAFCLTGCMVTPQDGHFVGDIETSGSMVFAGASFHPRERVIIMARHPEGGWRRIAETQTSSNPYVDANGEWYIWGAYLEIPDECWFHDGWNLVHAEFKAIAGGEECMCFKEGYDFLDDSQPLSTILEKWSCGTSVTVYGTR